MPGGVTMDLGLDKTKLQVYKAQLTKLLGHPAKMRVAVLAAMVGLAVAAIYMPSSDRIVRQRKLVAAEQKRLEAIREVEALRKEAKEYAPRISKDGDTSEWVQYLLEGCRGAKVRLRDMQTKEPRKIGPYGAVCLSMEVQGNFQQLRQFLEWLEQSDRLLRVDMMRIEKLPDVLLMKVNILGLTGKRA